MCKKVSLPGIEAVPGPAAAPRRATIISIMPPPYLAVPAEPPAVPAQGAAPADSDSPPGAAPAPRGSRRRRLWELDTHAHCPVVGVCLPMRTLRRLVGKLLDGPASSDDYELHSGAVMECKQRSRVAELLQRELDQRYAVPLHQATKAKTAEALAAQWGQALAGGDVAGALWATLTHPRCEPDLTERVLHDVHMLQHQAGAAHRADTRRLAELAEENAALARELATAQQRAAQAGAEQGRRIEQQQAQLVRLRADVLGRDTLIATLRDELSALEETVPGLRARADLARQVEQQQQRIQALERALALARQAEARRAGAAPLQTVALRAAAPADPLPEPAVVVALGERAVLCVGGRAASVPVYRQTIERVGGRFLHHDGGGEDNVVQLDASLAAADLVICQTGCISHDAYWRVKSHCKRTGKRCVFVENPSGASLQRALLALQEGEPARGQLVGERS